MVREETEMAKKPKFDAGTEPNPAIQAQDVETVPPTEAEAEAPKVPKAPKLNYHIGLSVNDGEQTKHVFAKRDPLKREHQGYPATIFDQEGAEYDGSVVVIEAREFKDNRVWITLPNGDVGRFLVPKDVVLVGQKLEITIIEGTIDYDREALRVRDKIARKKKEAAAETPADGTTPPTEAEAANVQV